MKKIIRFFSVLFFSLLFSLFIQPVITPVIRLIPVLQAEEQLPPKPENTVKSTPNNTAENADAEKSTAEGTAENAAESTAAEESAAEKNTAKEGTSAKRPPRRTGTRSKLPSGVFGAEKPASPNAADTMLGGTIPALWEIKRSAPATDDDSIPDLSEQNITAPPVPGKVLRYVMQLMQHYDHNMDGILQEEEWKKMSGTPQAIDIDGDRAITLDELIRFVAVYGQGRTIHHPQPVERYFQPKPVAAQFQLFKPFLPPDLPARSLSELPAPPVSADSEQTNVPPATDITEETMEENETPIDDDVYAEIIAKRLAPAVRKYDTAPDSLRGVPVWFLLRDVDGDGQVSLKEFAPTLSVSALGIFGRLDKNGDGFLIPDEVRAVPAQENKTAP